MMMNGCNYFKNGNCNRTDCPHYAEHEHNNGCNNRRGCYIHCTPKEQPNSCSHKSWCYEYSMEKCAGSLCGDYNPNKDQSTDTPIKCNTPAPITYESVIKKAQSTGYSLLINRDDSVTLYIKGKLGNTAVAYLANIYRTDEWLNREIERNNKRKPCPEFKTEQPCAYFDNYGVFETDIHCTDTPCLGRKQSCK